MSNYEWLVKEGFILSANRKQQNNGRVETKREGTRDKKGDVNNENNKDARQ